MKKVGILYHPKIPAARALAEKLLQALSSLNTTPWLSSAWDEERIREQIPHTDLAFSVGGDGTILRVVRAVIPRETLIVGVNLGNLGFMTELSAEEVMDKLNSLVAGEGWIDERAILEAEFFPASGKSDKPRIWHALNDVVVARRETPRIVYIETTIDGVPLTTYRCDGVIISTATGSTGYSLAAGGPILHPQAKELVLKPVAAHLSIGYALVLPPTARIGLEVHTDHQAMLTIDGQVNFSLQDGDKVEVRSSLGSVRFLRVHPPSFFYSTLERRLRVRS